jgi:hypothetical protein
MKFIHRSIIRQIRVVFAGVVIVICGATVRSYLTLFVALGIFSPVVSLQAGDTGQNRQVSPEIKLWAGALTNETGIGCCTIANGLIPEEIEWDISANSYRVKVDGQWLFVPDEAIIKAPNRLGYAAVWFEIDHDLEFEEYTISIRCFLPGAAA